MNKTKTNPKSQKRGVGDSGQEELVGIKRGAKVNKWITPVAMVVVVIIAALAMFRSWVVAAVVNGQPITRLALIREMEKQGGREVLESMIMERLIRQEAQKQGVSIEESQIDQQVAEIQTSLGDQKIEDVLMLQGLTLEGLRDQIRLQMLVEAMAGGETGVSDEEVAAYLEENSSLMPEDASAKERESLARNQLTNQKRQQSVQDWLKKLRDEAQISYWLSL